MEETKRYEYKLVIMGPPGSGKGTISELIENKLSIPHISMGDILRNKVKEGNEQGKKLKDIMKKGELIPNDIIEDLIKQRLSKDDVTSQFLLDGFPRELEQAQFLTRITGVDGIIMVDIDENTIVNRLSQRRICSSCEKGYHLQFKPPKQEGVCDDCGGKLVRREDDDPELIKKRLRTYHETTTPVIDFFEKKGIPTLEVPGDYDLETESDNIINQIVQWQESLRE